MGRTVIAHEKLWSYLKRFDHGNGFVVGLILGQVSKTTDYVVHMVRTPAPADADSTEASKQSSSGLIIPSLKDIKQDWIAEHVLQVTRMLPGGMWVLGLFLVGPTDPFSNQSECSRFRSILRFIRTELNHNSSLYGDSPSSEKLLLHVNNASNSFSCQTVDVDGGGSFTKATWKFEKEPVVWQQLDCVLDLQLVAHLDETDSSPPVKRPLQVFLDSVKESVTKSTLCVGGAIQNQDELLETVFNKPKDKSSSSSGSRKNNKSQSKEEIPKVQFVDLFLPMSGESKEVPKEKVFTCFEKINVTGSIAGSVFLSKKATVEDAEKAIKQDFVRSLAARVEMHMDSLIKDEQHSEGSPTLHEPPRRVRIPIPHTSVTLSEYLFAGEGSEEIVASCKEILDLTLSEGDVKNTIEVQADPDSMSWQACPELDPSAGSPAGRPAGRDGASSSSPLWLVSLLCGVLVLVAGLAVQQYLSRRAADQKK